MEIKQGMLLTCSASILWTRGSVLKPLGSRSLRKCWNETPALEENSTILLYNWDKTIGKVNWHYLKGLPRERRENVLRRGEKDAEKFLGQAVHDK